MFPASTKLWLLPFCVSCVAYSGCAAKPPRISVTSATLRPGSDAAVIDFQFVVRNPNSFVLPFATPGYSLALAGKRVLEVEGSGLLLDQHAGARQTVAFTLPATLPPGALDQSRRIVPAGESLPVLLEGEIQFVDYRGVHSFGSPEPFRVPFRYNGPLRELEN